MADRYWVTGGNGNWGSTTNWSATSGGSSGASVPTSSDNAIFDGNSGTGTVSLANTNRTCLNFDASAALSGLKINQSGSGNLTISGNCFIPSGVTYTGGASDLIFNSTSTGKTINIATTIAMTSGAVRFNGSGGGWTLQNNLTITQSTNAVNFVITNGTFSDGGFTITFGGKFAWGVGTATLNMTGDWITNGVGGGSAPVLDFATNKTNKTVNCTAGTIVIGNTTTATKKTFDTGGFTFYNFKVPEITAGNSGAAEIRGTSTFNSIILEPGAYIGFINSAAITVTQPPNWFGTASKPITINAELANQSKIIYSGGLHVNCDYLNLKLSNADGNTPFYAGANSTDAGNNLDWNFTGPPAYSDSFTESLTLTDSLAAAVTANTTTSDTLILSESLSATVEFNDAVSESLILTDSLSDELISEGGNTYDDAVEEALTLSDDLSAVVTFETSHEETLLLTDTFGNTATFDTSFSENLDLTESLNATASFVTPVLEIVTPSDSLADTQSVVACKWWDGFQWQMAPVFFWNGSTWARYPAKQWNGTEWVFVSSYPY